MCISDEQISCVCPVGVKTWAEEGIRNRQMVAVVLGLSSVNTGLNLMCGSWLSCPFMSCVCACVHGGLCLGMCVRRCAFIWMCVFADVCLYGGVCLSGGVSVCVEVCVSA